MASTDPAQQKRLLLAQMGISAIIGALAAAVFQASDFADRGFMFWALLAVMVSSVAEVAWFAAKYLRLTRDQERLV